MTSFRALTLPTVAAAARRYRALICRQELSTQSVPTELGGTLKIDATKVKRPIAITITSKWQELAQFDIPSGLYHQLLVEKVDEPIIKLVLEDTDGPKDSSVEHVSILVPEVFNLFVHGGTDMNLKTVSKVSSACFTRVVGEFALC
jgi:hypothetical protein